jgi:3-deoxy-D-arabino-heptulosonate 7-phosphate (DAHP) synthase
MQSEGYGETKELEIELPITLRGETMEAADHTHTFLVKFDENGKFLGGSTDTVNDHYHPIIRGTVTDDVEGHNHKFSFVELLNHG